MEERQEAKDIKIINDSTIVIEKNNIETEVIIKDFFKLINNEQIEITENNSPNETETWANIPNNIFEKFLSNYEIRTEIINKIVELILANNIDGVNINFQEISDYEAFKRFVIELTPRLREIGLSTSIKLNSEIKKDDFINIVDYIIN